MRKSLIPVLIALFLLGAAFGALAAARGQQASSPPAEVILQSETQGFNTRQVSGPAGSAPAQGSTAPNQPNIGFIDSPTAGCVQPDPAKNECYINWYYMSVDAAPNYMITMTAYLNDFGMIGRYAGFFQTSMYVPFNMNPSGYKVACGADGSGGQPHLGKAYGYAIRARDSANLSSANYGTVYCPPFP